MDELTAEQRRPTVQFGPDVRLTGLAAVAAVVAAGLGIAAGDGAGRLLYLLAAAVLAGYVASDLAFRPRLAVDAQGVTVRSALVRTRLSWPEIEQVRADSRIRYGLRLVTLEIDAGEQLVVLSRRSIGTDPVHVAAVVASFDPRPDA